MQMTKNDYKEYMKQCANKIYTVPEYSLEQYGKDLDAVEILPLDLAKYNLSPEIEKWINKLFDEDDTDRNGNYMLRGFTRCEGAEMRLLGLTYGDYSNSISFWGYNDTEYLIYTFCEGDTTLKLFANREEYEREKQETYEWYKEAAA